MIKKIAISYPPLESNKGTPCLAQNRQFQWFAGDPTFVFPVIPAYTATLLKKSGYDVFWDDGIAEQLKFDDWLDRLVDERPDLIMMETKTPTVHKLRQIIDRVKEELPNCLVALVGDHITAFPEESFSECKVDYCLRSWDFDFSVLNLVEWFNWKKAFKGGWYREENWKILNSWIQETKDYDLNSLPFIDRELVNWKQYAYKNGNFKYTPGTYTMVWRDCWWGKCTFCSWTTYFPWHVYRVQSVDRLLDDIENNLIPLWVKEIFDDSGSFPAWERLLTFCKWMIERWLHKKITFSCNMRFGTLSKEHYVLMAKANFRYVLYGVESANQKTLDMIDKNLKFDVIEKELKLIKEINKEYKWQISPHITTMIWYPWETYEDAKKTIDFAKKLFKDWLIETLQSTIIMPYPWTPLYKQALENDRLLVEDWDRENFDMRKQVLKSQLTEAQTKDLVQSVYKSFLTPRFILKKILWIRCINDIKYLFKAFIKLMNHLLDFKKWK